MLSPPRWGVAVGSLHLHNTVADFKDRDVKRTAAEFEYGDGFVLLLSRPYASAAAVGSLMMRNHFETRDLAGVFGRLALRVVEVGRNGDYGLVTFSTQIGLGRFLQFRKDHGRDLGRGVALSLNFDAGVAVFAGRTL